MWENKKRNIGRKDQETGILMHEIQSGVYLLLLVTCEAQCRSATGAKE